MPCGLIVPALTLACRNDATIGRSFTLSGPKAWTTKEVIKLCEKMASTNAQVRLPFMLKRPGQDCEMLC